MDFIWEPSMVPAPTATELQARQDLLQHADETGKPLVLHVNMIVALESVGAIIDLEAPPHRNTVMMQQRDDWRDFTRRWVEACRHYNTPTTWARLSVALAQAEGLPAVEDRPAGYWEPYCERAQALLAEIAY